LRNANTAAKAAQHTTTPHKVNSAIGAGPNINIGRGSGGDSNLERCVRFGKSQPPRECPFAPSSDSDDHGIMTMIERSFLMKTMAAGQFKVHCLKVMDEVQSKRQAVLITKRGKPVAKLVPIEKEKDDIFGFLKGKGKIEIKGDIVAPAISPEEWGDLY
jgi:prevent-host-death family protein